MSKRNAITLLYALDILIILSGITLTINSFIQNTEFKFMNTGIPGYLFGFVVIFLGIRYFKSIQRLKSRISTTKAAFSWENFKILKGKSQH